MNPVIRDLAETVQLGGLMGAMTVVFFVFFVGWTAWAYWPSRREAMNQAAQMPLDDE